LAWPGLVGLSTFLKASNFSSHFPCPYPTRILNFATSSCLLPAQSGSILLHQLIFLCVQLPRTQQVVPKATMDSAMIDSLNTSNHVMITNHPYYPLEVEIASYLANEWSVPTLLGIFAATCATIFLGTYFVVNKVHPHLPRGEKAAIWWFVLCTFSFLFSIPIRVLELHWVQLKVTGTNSSLATAGAIHLFFEGMRCAQIYLGRG
jgi:hypothetical protein